MIPIEKIAKKWIRRTLRLLLCLSLLVYPLCFVPLTAYGWLQNAAHYGAGFRTYAIVTFGCCALLLAGAGLCFAKRDLAACACVVLGAVPILVILHRVCTIADRFGWAPHAPAHMGQLASDIWQVRVVPVTLPAGLILLLSLCHFFSYDAVCARRRRRETKSAANSEDAPKILEDCE